ncbi:short-chain dehydrogenase/reductase [Pigmentiphaga sp. NML080357]|uniref:oxidoreductase n=1 Tax=Pigmentiphaga sp. NML080357 TaxID=2008675 RepID=UPI000B422484|nr:oxidoreductase [Pigmentiphaga sp. NML080357]OVZ63744.1 short-chain dehydrogenase/reductase [Pigmentiphaga sp. NML080357]
MKKTWFITGASRGFGALIVERALAQGDAVVATARKPQAVTERFGAHPNLLALPLDVTDESQAHEAAQAAVERFGRIDILVNNAGYGLLGAVEEASGAEVEALYRTNVFGLLAVTRAVLPHMRRQRSGRILNLSSIGGYRSGPGFGVYCSTKFAVEGLTEALAAELGPLGIHVTAIEPGYFRTDFLDSTSLSTSPLQIEDYAASAGAVRSFAARASHAQPGDPEKLADVIVAFVDTPAPPVRLPLGSDTVAAIEEKHASDAALLAAWRTVSVSTDFAAPAARAA